MRSSQATSPREFEQGRGLADYLEVLGRHLDAGSDTLRNVAAHDSAWSPDEFVVSGLPEILTGPLGKASLLVAAAFNGLSQHERTDLLDNAPDLLATLSRGSDVDEGDTTEAAERIRTLRLAKRVDMASLIAAAEELSRIAAPRTLRRIRKEAAKLGRDQKQSQLPSTLRGEFVYASQTDWGWVLIGDRGDNFYGEDAALIVDLGGDDVYFNNSGSPVFVPDGGSLEQLSPVGVLIDYDGDDHYLGNAWGSIGSGLGGVGLLLDLKGDDLYHGSQLTQGAAFCGVGVLWDQKGNDEYLAQDEAQGAAFFGAGMLLDGRGSDLYSAAQMSQAFGGSRGFGLLYDKRGDDRYLADRKVPSSYGTRGVYRGWSQGVGRGIRGFAAGGIGLLLDSDGDDDYQAGNFSQGTEYFFALGLLVDRRGNDLYRGSRYCQGASAHQAVGVLLEGDGDDSYLGGQGANQGGAWDASVSILEDRAGDDRYEGQGLSQGAAAMNGVGLLFDWGGRDRYFSTSGQGDGGSTTYWGGRGAQNVGIFIDAGGGRGRRVRPDRSRQRYGVQRQSRRHFHGSLNGEKRAPHETHHVQQDAQKEEHRRTHRAGSRTETRWLRLGGAEGLSGQPQECGKRAGSRSSGDGTGGTLRPDGDRRGRLAAAGQPDGRAARSRDGRSGRIPVETRILQARSGGSGLLE